MIFENRQEAGKLLAERLKKYAKDPQVLVLGLARGGVVVASKIAEVLSTPLDTLIVRKIGAPDQPELALGAVGSSGSAFFNDSLISLLGVSKQYLQREVERQRALVEERVRTYYAGRSPLPVEGKTVILVDDGIATGATMKMGVSILRSAKVSQLIIAVPVASAESLKELEAMVEEIVCLHRPSYFEAVGAFYRHFEEVTDRDVLSLLSKFSGKIRS